MNYCPSCGFKLTEDTSFSKEVPENSLQEVVGTILDERIKNI